MKELKTLVDLYKNNFKILNKIYSLNKIENKTGVRIKNTCLNKEMTITRESKNRFHIFFKEGKNFDNVVYSAKIIYDDTNLSDVRVELFVDEKEEKIYSPYKKYKTQEERNDVALKANTRLGVLLDIWKKNREKDDNCIEIKKIEFEDIKKQ